MRRTNIRPDLITSIIRLHSYGCNYDDYHFRPSTGSGVIVFFSLKFVNSAQHAVLRSKYIIKLINENYYFIKNTYFGTLFSTLSDFTV